MLGKEVNDSNYNLKVGSREGRIREMPLTFIKKSGIGSCSRRKLDKEEANSLRRMVHVWNSFH